MPDAHPLRSGDPTELGGYQILGRLGEGGQSAVFLGRPVGAADDLPAEDHVAIKLLHGGLAGDDSARARFVRELEVAKRVARFCTAQVLDADVAGDQPYIVSGSKYNCAVMIKSKKVGEKSPASVWIQKKGGSTISDSGRFAWYAGPVYVKAPGTCVRFGGNGRSAPYGNCG